MPSQMKSWFARHMTPPPPLNATPTCPCAKCFNVLAQRPHTGYAHHRQQEQQQQQQQQKQQQKQQQQQQQQQYGQYGYGAPARRDSDEITLAGDHGYDITTTTHIEMARSK
ncbi:hypothetical protein E4U54_008187 [Claviceps lovelessii]|nr:hypothetical protein E4U54_008187 [Claviceps lovelessii]